MFAIKLFFDRLFRVPTISLSSFHLIYELKFCRVIFDRSGAKQTKLRNVRKRFPNLHFELEAKFRPKQFIIVRWYIGLQSESSSLTYINQKIREIVNGKMSVHLLCSLYSFPQVKRVSSFILQFIISLPYLLVSLLIIYIKILFYQSGFNIFFLEWRHLSIRPALLALWDSKWLMWR